MSTVESNENSVVLALIGQNYALQTSLVDIIRARDANDAEHQAYKQSLDQQNAEQRAEEVKESNKYYQQLSMMLIPEILPLIQRFLQPQGGFSTEPEEPEQD